MGKTRLSFSWTVVAAGAAMSFGAGTRPCAAQSGSTMALTISGLPSAPHATRSVRVADGTVGIRFESPADLDLAAVQLTWRRADASCTLALQNDAGDVPGDVLATGTVEPGTGWRQTALAARLVAGQTYHLVASCDPTGRARLAYVLDRDSAAVAAGAWQMEDYRGARVRRRQPPASPLFVLTFADGTSWGHPYNARRRTFRICGDTELAAVIASASRMTIEGVDLTSGDATGLGFVLESDAGAYIMDGQAGQSTAPVILEAGTPYVLRLRAPDAAGCVRVAALSSDLPLGPAAHGIRTLELRRTVDGGRSWGMEEMSTVSAAFRLVSERCGDGVRQAHEECDGADDRACPNSCTADCTCAAPSTTTTTLPVATTTSTTTRPTTTSTTTTITRRSTTTTTVTATTTTSRPPTTSTSTTSTTRPPTTTTTTTRPPTTTTTTTSSSTSSTSVTTTTQPSGRTYRAPYAAGYLGNYDPNVIPIWPRRMVLMLGEANAQGPLLANARQVAASAGNTDARFIFYFSLTDMDSRCSCFDQGFYDSIRTSHPEWLLRSSSGALISDQNGYDRVYVTDIGNPAYIDAWLNWAFTAITRYGWDGVFVDNVFRGYFGSWTATPINPRTGNAYTAAEYRRDMLAALQRMRARFDAAGKFFVGNHSAAWDPATFADPNVQQQVLTMHGTEIEDCVFDFNGNRHNEANWMAQLRYLDYANRNGVRTLCSAPGGAIGNSTSRWYVLATYLLTKEGLSSLADINGVGTWWSGLDSDLGRPQGAFYCLDPSNGLARTTSCPSTGKIYGRDWEHGRVLVNPTGSTTVTVQLGETLLNQGSSVTSVTLGPGSGVVLVRP